MRRLAMVVLFAAVWASTGCRWWDIHGRGFERDATWGESYRAAGGPGESVGIDTRAQQIERSLGVQ